MNRRGFMATVAAVLAAPKAMRLAPIETAAPRLFGPLPMTGIAGWLPVDPFPPFFAVERTYQPPLLPTFGWDDGESLEDQLEAAMARVRDGCEREYWS
jgi:hypothetical protein